MSVCCECCVLSGRGLCDGLITRPEGSHRLWCVAVCDLETSWMRRPRHVLGRSATGSTLVLIFFVRLSVRPNNVPQQWINHSDEGPYFRSVSTTSCSTFHGIFMTILDTIWQVWTGLRGWTIEESWFDSQQGQGVCLFSKMSWPQLGLTEPPPYFVSTRDFSARVKRLGCEAFRPPQSRSEMKNECCNSPTPPYAFMTRKRTNLLLPFRNFQKMKYEKTNIAINPSNAELNAIFHLLALLGARPILHVSSIGVNLSSEGRSSIRTSQWNRLLFFTYKKWLILFRK